MMSTKKNAVCNTCTIKLVHTAYQRAPWFRLVREPLKTGMRFLAWAYRIDAFEYQVRTPACYGCMRFYKLALKDRSAFFRWLNDRVNPTFDTLLERIVTREEIQEAKRFARSATSGQIMAEEAEAYLNFDEARKDLTQEPK